MIPVDLQRGAASWQSTSIPNIGGTAPSIVLRVPPGLMPRSLHFGIAGVGMLYNRGFKYRLKFTKDGADRGSLELFHGSTDLFALGQFNTALPAVIFVNALGDGGPADVPGLLGAGATPPPDSLVWDIDTPTGTAVVMMTAATRFLADIDRVELIMDDPGYWQAGGMLADANVVGAGFGYLYFRLGMFSNAI